MDGILLINKPIYWTSFDVVKYIRKFIPPSRNTKVGHAGTLDPLAQGLLIICIGKMCQFVQSLMNKEKEYVVRIKLGEKRDTDDISGVLIESKEIFHISKTNILEALQEFRGEFYQVPPMYSALKLDGVPLYKLARSGHHHWKGKVIERQARKVQISEIKLLHYIPPLLGLKVICGKGTYIRALARDLGERLGCGGCVKSLVRTRIGEFKLSQAVSPKSIRTTQELENLILSGAVTSPTPTLGKDEGN